MRHSGHLPRSTGLLTLQRPRHLMRRLRRLFARAAVEQNELAILRGVLSAVQGGKQMRRTDAQLTQISGEVPNS